MKPIKAFLFVLLSCMQFTIAADNTTPAPVNSESTILQEKKKFPNGARKPSNKLISCFLIDGELWFEPNFETAYLDVTVTDQWDTVVAEGTATPSTPVYAPMLEAGSYTVTCTTDASVTYEGTLTLN